MTEFPKTRDKLNIMLKKYQEDIKEIDEVIIDTEKLIINILTQMIVKKDGTDWSLIEDFHLYCLREKYIYQNMLCLKLTDSGYTHVLAWIERKKFMSVSENLTKLNIGNNIAPCQLTLVEDTQKTPPTLLKTNEFTSPFQVL
jgi:V-type H+-transporting ATPase subunit a